MDLDVGNRWGFYFVPIARTNGLTERHHDLTDPEDQIAGIQRTRIILVIVLDALAVLRALGLYFSKIWFVCVGWLEVEIGGV